MALLCRFFIFFILQANIFGFFQFYVPVPVPYSRQCFICRPSDSTVLEDDGIVKPMNFATKALTARRCNKSPRSHPHRLDLIHFIFFLACLIAALRRFPSLYLWFTDVCPELTDYRFSLLLAFLLKKLSCNGLDPRGWVRLIFDLLI